MQMAAFVNCTLTSQAFFSKPTLPLRVNTYIWVSTFNCHISIPARRLQAKMSKNTRVEQTHGYA
jgi:hypothetical protein